MVFILKAMYNNSNIDASSKVWVDWKWRKFGQLRYMYMYGLKQK